MFNEHVKDWWRAKGYRVFELMDGTLMCVHEVVFLTTPREKVDAALRRLLKARGRHIR